MWAGVVFPKQVGRRVAGLSLGGGTHMLQRRVWPKLHGWGGAACRAALQGFTHAQAKASWTTVFSLNWTSRPLRSCRSERFGRSNANLHDHFMRVASQCRSAVYLVGVTRNRECRPTDMQT